MADPISIQEFQRIDLRVGTVLDVRDHPNASKLYVMDVDLGPELGTRQLVAGMKPYIAADALKGQLVVVVANLEPAILRGQRSEGMLLAAQEGDNVVCLTTASPLAPGSKVL
ncbi:MAG: hypothetical protein ISS74_10205 [Planctomycetes bacterium]|nr:hypothetical protein [Planctomycetota bacterium]